MAAPRELSVAGLDPLLTRIVVAPVTRTVRSIPTELRLGPDEGLAFECAASFDNLQPIRCSYLTERIGAIGWRRVELCDALAALADCEAVLGRMRPH